MRRPWAEGRVTLSDCEVAARHPADQQDGLLALKLSSTGMNREQLKEASRKAVAPKAEAVRVQRLKCDLPGGVSVSVSGADVSLDESIEALGNAIKEMKRARELGYTAKTFAAAMRDRAKAG